MSWLSKTFDKVKNAVSSPLSAVVNPLSLNGGFLSKLTGGSFSDGIGKWNLGTLAVGGAGLLGASGALGGLGAWASSNPMLASALGFGAMNLGTSLYSANQQARLQQEQNEINMQMMREMNQYNSPSSQMERYRQAGLNPNLLYSQISSGNQSSPVSQQAISRSAYRALNFDKWMQGFSKQLYSAQLDTQKLENAQRALDLQSTSISNQYRLGLARNALERERFEFDKNFKNKSLATRIAMFNNNQRLALADYQLRKDNLQFNKDNRIFNAGLHLLDTAINAGINSFVSPIGIVR